MKLLLTNHQAQMVLTVGERLASFHRQGTVKLELEDCTLIRFFKSGAISVRGRAILVDSKWDNEREMHASLDAFANAYTFLL